MESSQHQSRVSTEAAAVLRPIWDKLSGDGNGRPPRSEVQIVASRVCAAAHESDILPEQLVVMLKESWSSFPPRDRKADRVAAQLVFDEIVTACIAEFYRPGS
jgi:hypothetical protein